MFLKLISKYSIILSIFAINLFKSEENKGDNNPFIKRCDPALPKDKSEQYDKCEAEASDAFKGYIFKNFISIF